MQEEEEKEEIDRMEDFNRLSLGESAGFQQKHSKEKKKLKA